MSVIGQARSAYDGFYIIGAIPPGTYSLRIAPDQLQRLSLKAAHGETITLAFDNQVLSGRDLLLIRTNNKFASEKYIANSHPIGLSFRTGQKRVATAYSVPIVGKIIR